MIEELKEIRRYLPTGYCRKLAKEFGCSDMTASNALRGKNKRFDIIRRALEMARESKRSLEELEAFTSETRKEERLPSPINC
jgi:predicted transcriptional regulator